jgi:outer membrane protein assembly factor BamB
LIVVLVPAVLTPGPQAATGHESVPEVAPAWSLQFGGTVAWQRVTPLGHLMVSTSDGLYGVDPAAGKLVWRHGHLRHLDEDEYEEIHGTPFVVVSGGKTNARVTVLDAGSGRIIFDSTAAGIVRLVSEHVLPQSRSLLVIGFREGDKEATMSLFDIATGKKRWTNSEIGLSGSSLASALTAIVAAMTDMKAAEARPVELSKEEFLVTSGGRIYKVAAQSGKILWKISDMYGVSDTSIYLNERRPQMLFVGASAEVSSASSIGGPATLNSFYGAYSLVDGRKIWPEPIRVQGGLNDIIFIDRGMIISPRTDGKGKIKLVDYDSGRSLWGKKGRGIKVTGGIVDHDSSRHGIILTTGYDSAWNDKGAVYMLNILDPRTGTLRFEKPIKMEGRILSIEVVSKGVLFVTTSEVNILNPVTGELLRSRSIESRDSLVSNARGNDLFVFSQEEGALYHIDKQAASFRKLSKERIELEGKEKPAFLEVRRDGFILGSQQNLIAFKRNGEKIYQVYYPAPRRPALVRALLRAEAIRAGMASFAAGATGGAMAVAASEQPEGSVNRAIGAGLAEGYGEMSEQYAGVSRQYWQAASQRFKASAASRDFVFMMVKFRKGDLGLAKVSKRNGAMVGMIDLNRDKEPSYQVDSISNQIYYRVSPTEVVGYRF